MIPLAKFCHPQVHGFCGLQDLGFSARASPVHALYTVPVIRKMIEREATPKPYM